jgi:hypothetical protein
MQVNATDIEVKTETDSKQNGNVVIKMEHLKKSFGNNQYCGILICN